MVLGKLSVPGRPTKFNNSIRQVPIALAVGAEHFLSRLSFLFSFSRYRLKYCLKGPLNPKQLTNQIHS